MKWAGSLSLLLFFLLSSLAFLPLITGGTPEVSHERGVEFQKMEERSVHPDQVNFDTFIENKGQWDEEILFSARTSFGHIGACDRYILLDVRQECDDIGYVLRYEFLGSRDITPIGMEEQSFRTNYFYGSDPGGWVTGARSYGSLFYQNIWDRIDLRYYFNGNDLKYEFILHPGADPSDIKIGLEGHTDIVGSDDRLEIFLSEDGISLMDDDLAAYYADGGSAIGSEFLIYNDGIFGFALDEYDRDREVIIDPLIFSTYIGGGGYDSGNSLDVDVLGNSFITGSTDSSSFPTTTGAYTTSKNSYSDVFVCKMNSTGRNLLYSTFIGSSSYDYGEGIVVDSEGYAYVTGRTDEIWNGGNETNTTTSDFPTTTGAYDTSHNGGTDVFILKLNPTGSSLIYSTFVGSNSSEYGYGIDIDSSGNAYVTGYTYSRDFPTTAGAYSTTYAGGQESYVLKLNRTGGALLFSTFLGGSGSEEAYAVRVDSSGNSFITGSTSSSDFPTTASAYDTSYNSNWDVFLTKLNSTGKGLLYSTYIGGKAEDIAYDVEINGSGVAFVTGYTDYYYSGGNGSNATDSNFPVTNGAYDQSHNGNRDCFVFKMNSAGSTLLYSTYLGGYSDDIGRGLTVDSNGYAVVTGHTYSSNFPTRWGSYDTSHNGRYDIFVSRLTSSGASLNYSTFVGGSYYDWGYDIHHDSDDYVIVTGATSSSNFPTSNNSYDSSINGRDDVCLFKLDFIKSAPPMPPTNLSGIMYTDNILLTWDPPEDEGTSKLLGYYVYRNEFGGNGSGNISTRISRIATIGPADSWRDFGITIGRFYEYYIVAYSAVGISDNSNWCFVTDDIRPVFLTDWTPSQAYTGEALEFKIEVWENVLIDNVEVIYWHPGAAERNGTLLQSDDMNWTLSVNIHLDAPDRLHYRFRAVDYYHNFGESDLRSIDMIKGRPFFVADLTPEEGTTGDSFEFLIEVRDNSVVSEVCVEYWYGSGYQHNVTMAGGPGDAWSYKTTLENTTAPLNYFFHAMDGFSNWNQTDIKQVAVVDNDIPTIVTDETPSTGYTGEQMAFSVKVSDNIDMASVSVEYWFGEGDHENITMDEWPEELWKASIRMPLNDLTSLHYKFRLTDINSNIALGPERTVQNIDNILPAIIADHTPGIGYAGRSFKFIVHASDNIGVSEVWIEYRFKGGEISNLSAEKTSDQYWELVIPIPHSLDDLFYVIHVRDSSDNWLISDNETSEIIDKVKPVFWEDRTPQEVNTGDELVFGIDISDNIGVGMVRVEYWFGAGDHFNTTMEGSGPYTLTIQIDVDEKYDVYYVFHAMDIAQNWNDTQERMVIVADDDPPEFSGDTTPTTGKGGEKFTISVYVDDNIGVSNISVEYWIDDGEHEHVVMTGYEPYRIILDLPEDNGTLYYRFHVTDSSGNSIVSDIKEVIISKKIDQGPGGGGAVSEPNEDTPSWLWLLVVVLIFLFILTIVNITMFVIRGKRRRPVSDLYIEQQPMAPIYEIYQGPPEEIQKVSNDQGLTENQHTYTELDGDILPPSEISEEVPPEVDDLESEKNQPPEIDAEETDDEIPPEPIPEEYNPDVD